MSDLPTRHRRSTWVHFRMTGYGLVASLAWTASAVLFVARTDRFVNRWLDARTKDPQGVPPIPDDLMALALSENAGSEEATKQAQQSVLDAIAERFRQYKDWNKVRAAMGVGMVPEV